MQQLEAMVTEFQSTLSVRRATFAFCHDSPCEYISIHALRKESDRATHTTTRRTELFQSTLSVRRATRPQFGGDGMRIRFQSTLSVRRATWRSFINFQHTNISIHALRKESDTRCPAAPGLWSETFQSTLSVRRATVAVTAPINHVIISIHALRKESDLCRSGCSRELYDFNPRSP